MATTTIGRPLHVGLAACLCVVVSSASAQGYPERPIRMVVGFTPGGGTDTVARLVGLHLAERLGQPVVVDNRPGAGGSVATEMVARAAPDGYTLIMVSGSHTINPNLLKRKTYDPVNDFSPVTHLARSQYLLTVVPSLPVRSVKDLIALAKTKPGTLNYASAGVGSPPHMAAELFRTMTGIDIVHVPFKGSGPLTTAIVGGQVQLTFGNMGNVLPHVRSGKLRGLAVSGSARSPAAPEFPTVAEAGVPGFEATGWYGVLAPAGTPSPIVQRLHGSIAAVLGLADVTKRLEAQGLEVTSTPPAPFDAYIRAENAKWERILKGIEKQ